MEGFELIKILFMAKEIFASIHALEYLCKNKDVYTVVGGVVRDNDFELIRILNENNVNIYTEESLGLYYTKGKLRIDYIISFYWKRIKKDILNIPYKGSINFHPGPLPEARGSGYHVAILENWGYWGVTAHYMDEEFDTGKIILCERFSVENNILNCDLVEITHFKLYELFEKVMNLMERNVLPLGEKQGDGYYYSKHDMEESKYIKDDDSDDLIEKKIRAFWHPPYRGAIIKINGKEFTVVSDEILRRIYEKKHLN